LRLRAGLPHGDAAADGPAIVEGADRDALRQDLKLAVAEQEHHPVRLDVSDGSRSGDGFDQPGAEQVRPALLLGQVGARLGSSRGRFRFGLNRRRFPRAARAEGERGRKRQEA
jgi:hypothetical protein